VRHRADDVAVRVVGIDDWSGRKGTTYGTIMVDLERREVVDILQDRSADSTAGWLGGHLAVELVSRDRCGLYAHGAAREAPQARQVANRKGKRRRKPSLRGGVIRRVSPHVGRPRNRPIAVMTPRISAKPFSRPMAEYPGKLFLPTSSSNSCP
jgi:hypothetical protein